MARLKAEFTAQYHKANGVPLRSRLIANFTKLSQLSQPVSGLYNFAFGLPGLGPGLRKIVGFAPERSMPKLHRQSLKHWFKKYEKEHHAATPVPIKKVWLFADEFTNYNDVELGKTAVKLLEKLNYRVAIPKHEESARTYISKGLLKEAQQIAQQNVQLLHEKVTDETPLVGIEPSAILGFRDEYPDLVGEEWQQKAGELGKNCLLLEEFLAAERDAGNIRHEQFTQEQRLVKVHGHCHQKALASLTPTKKLLTLPQHYKVHFINSGCCGMAGSFGYEAEHYDISMQIGELVLFPAVRQQPEEVLIAAAGTSCRHQIKDGTGRVAKHPVELLYEALV
jgi:Fe-S oxidoreductase